jgi:hypothetical protein
MGTIRLPKVVSRMPSSSTRTNMGGACPGASMMSVGQWDGASRARKSGAQQVELRFFIEDVRGDKSVMTYNTSYIYIESER